MTTDETGIVWGRNLKCEEYSLASNMLNHCVEPDYDCASEHGFWPMSERCYNNLLPVRGFREHNGPTYRDYVVEYLSHSPPAGADEASWVMLTTRKKQLADLEATGKASVFELGYAQRAIDVAREVYGWARGADWAKRNDKPFLSVYDGYDYFEPWRVVSGLDYWIVPSELKTMLAETINAKSGPQALWVDDPPTHCPLEITLEAHDDEPEKVVYSQKERTGWKIVATAIATRALRETWLDDDEMLKRRKAANERKRARDTGENYFDLEMPIPNPADNPAFWTWCVADQMKSFPTEWRPEDKFRAVLVCEGAKDTYEHSRRVQSTHGLRFTQSPTTSLVTCGKGE